MTAWKLPASRRANGAGDVDDRVGARDEQRSRLGISASPMQSSTPRAAQGGIVAADERPDVIPGSDQRRGNMPADEAGAHR